MVFVFDANATPTKGVNSYVTEMEVVGYATAHGYTGDVLIADRVRPFIFRAMDFIESFRGRYKGQKTVVTQPLQWPRTGVDIENGQVIANDLVPDEIREAVAVCAVEMLAGYDPDRPLRPADDAQIAENISVLGSRVSERYLVNWGISDVLPRVEALLRPFIIYDSDDVLVT